MTTRSPVIELRQITKTFGTFTAVHSIDLSILEGEFFTIVGPSGSGKTTVLRMLAGMESPSSGDILLKGERINDVPANRRPTCMVFQSLALFPHRTVGQNIEFALKIRGDAAASRRARAFELMDLLRLPRSYYKRGVTQISGGERQRVALARAFAYDPQILFFDEPLSAIDYKLRKTLEKELKDLHKETGKTFIYITHSLEEAMVMSDRIGVMRAGRLVQVGTPEDIYTRPTDKFVSEFMGEVNVIAVERTDDGRWRGLDVPGTFAVNAPDGVEARSAYVVVRPEFLRFVRGRDEADNAVEGIVYNEYTLGSRVQYQVRVGEKVLTLELSRANAWRGGLDVPVLV